MSGFESRFTDNVGMENALTKVTSNGYTITAVLVDDEAITEDCGYQLVELIDPFEALLLVSKSMLDSLFKVAETDFKKGFNLGIFVGQVMVQSLYKLAQED